MIMDIGVAWIPLLLTFLAGMSTAIGSFISLFMRKLEKRYLCLTLGFSAGVMIYVSFTELLRSSIDSIGFAPANVAFFAGIVAIMAIDFSIPHEYIEERVRVDKKNRKLMAAGVFTAIGIAIHNFPEGIAVFMSALSDLSVGIPLAIAIAIHNIPEGIAVSMPIYYATKDHLRAFKYSFLSGLAEPVGALLAFALLFPFLTSELLALSLAFVAGIMVFISVDELIPLSYKHGEGKYTIIGIIVGMGIMAFSLYLF
jgi:ZIP family zinc transporter